MVNNLSEHLNVQLLGYSEDDKQVFSNISINGILVSKRDIDDLISDLEKIKKNITFKQDTFEYKSKQITDSFLEQMNEDFKKIENGAPTVHDALFKEGFKDEAFTEKAKDVMNNTKDYSCLHGNENIESAPSRIKLLEELNDLKKQVGLLTKHALRFETSALDKEQKDAQNNECSRDEGNPIIVEKQYELRKTQDDAVKIQNELIDLLKRKEMKKNPTPFVLMELEKQGAYKKCCEVNEEGKSKLNKEKFHNMINEAIEKVRKEANG